MYFRKYEIPSKVSLWYNVVRKYEYVVETKDVYLFPYFRTVRVRLYVYSCTRTRTWSYVYFRKYFRTLYSTLYRKNIYFRKKFFPYCTQYNVHSYTYVYVYVYSCTRTVWYCNLLKFNLICYYVYSSCSCTVVVYFTFITFAHILDTCTCTTSTALHVLAHVHSYTHARTMRVQYTYSTCTCSRVDVYRM